MNSLQRFQGSVRHLYTHWPRYATLYGGLILAVLGLGLAAGVGWRAPLLLLLAVVVLLLQALLATLWSIHRLYDAEGLRPHHILFEMGQLRDTDDFAFIDLDGRHLALELGQRLTSGQIGIIDIYNPQLTPSRALVRGRSRGRHPGADPRFVWRNGRFDLLPLPDESVAAVVLCEVLSEYWQAGDRDTLLREVRRILRPHGRLLVAERTRSRRNWLVMGPEAIKLNTRNYWHDLIRHAGFAIQRVEDLDGLIVCYRADKPVAAQAQQLILNLR